MNHKRKITAVIIVVVLVYILLAIEMLSNYYIRGTHIHLQQNQMYIIKSRSSFMNTRNLNPFIKFDRLFPRYNTKSDPSHDVSATEDLMKLAPFKFLPNYKNPCWLTERKEGPIGCMPYFYLAGAPKAGTTDVFNKLTEHADVVRYAVKEPHWWSRYRFQSFKTKFSYYVAKFASEIDDIYGNMDTSGFHSKVFGDCSASTLWDNTNWKLLPENKNRTEPLYTNPDFIHHLNPGAKIIVMVRDPVERLYSDYIYFEMHSKSPELFHERVVKMLRYTQTCLETYSLRRCINAKLDEQDGKMLHIRTYIGLYHVHIADYLRVFPRRQILVVKLEEYSKNIVGYMKRMFNFLELPSPTSRQMAMITKLRKVNKNYIGKLSTGPMLNKTRILLEAYYRPHNDKLAELLGHEFNYNK